MRKSSSRGSELRLGVPERHSSELGPCTGIGNAFQGLFSHFVCMQNRGEATAVRWGSGGWVRPVAEETHDCTAEIRNKPMEEQPPWKISCPVAMLIVSALEHGQITLQSRAWAGYNPPEPDMPSPGDTPSLIPSLCQMSF